MIRQDTTGALALQNPNNPHVVVLGIGDPRLAEVHFGVAALESLSNQFTFSAQRACTPGDLSQSKFRELIEQASHLLIFDNVDCELEPGSLKVMRGREVAECLASRPNQSCLVCYEAALAKAIALSDTAEQIVLVGVQRQPASEPHLQQRASLLERVPVANAIALDILRTWGVKPSPRPACWLAADAYRASPNSRAESAYGRADERSARQLSFRL